MSDMIGRRLDKYEITDLIGEGGMATVYRARQLNVRRDVAIKVIKPALAERERYAEFVKRFDREAETIASLDHPHILKLFDYGQEGDLLFLVMPLLTGGSLSAQIRRDALGLSEIARLLDQIAGALDYAHELGIVHRDLKPQNVLLDAKGNAILTDFGIAKLLSETTALTQSGVAMGTPSYMAPEQWQNQALDGRADIYALGVILFEMLTGKLPFDADTPLQMMYAHMNERPRPARKLRGDLAESIERVIAKALAKRPEDRFQTAGALAAAFRVAMTGRLPSELETSQSEGDRTASTPVGLPRISMPREAAPTPPQRGGRGWIVGGALAVMALIVGGMAVLGGGAPTPTPVASETASVVVVAPTGTLTPARTPIPPSATLAPSNTASATATATLTDTPGSTPIPPTVTETPNLETLVAGIAATDAQATLDAIASYTHTSTNTSTPTPDLPGTARAIVNTTGTAVAVASFTKTPTPTATAVPTFTPTFTPMPTLTPTPSMFPAGVKPNWTPVERSFDGVIMVLVPAGCFMMGSSEAQIDYALELAKKYSSDVKRELFDDEKTVHEICFDQPVWIDRYEVSQAQFRQFNGQASRAPNFTGNNLPVEQITWFEAKAYCETRGARLPTEAEWEYAARGPESKVYPWGNTFDGNRANYCDSNCEYNWKDKSINDGYQYTAPVGNYRDGASWMGALDMSGNVWEWVADWYDGGYYAQSPQRNPQGPATGSARVVRGGSWFRVEFDLRASDRYGFDPGLSYEDLGLRCARAFAEGEVGLSPAPQAFSTPVVVVATPIPAGTSNKVWTPVERDFDGVTMVLVPAGCFMMGSNDGSDDEKPVHEICFDQTFWIDKYEVSQAQFRQFNGQASNSAYFKGDNLPVEQITWFESKAFCETRGARLLTEAEWEYAARGPESKVYPWGNTFEGKRVDYCDSNCEYDWKDKSVNDGYQYTARVGSYRDGASWVGALDLSGNVWEWLNSQLQAYPYQPDDGREEATGSRTDISRVFRGGSWYDSDYNLRGASRFSFSPDTRHYFLGFRCARFH